MKRILAPLIGVALLLFGPAQAVAETPKNVLVMALQFDDIITRDAGTHFDPALVEPFRECADAFDRIRLKNPDTAPAEPAVSV